MTTPPLSPYENINAGISVLVDSSTEVEHLDAILTTLRKHGLAPRYFEYEDEQDGPKHLHSSFTGSLPEDESKTVTFQADTSAVDEAVSRMKDTLSEVVSTFTAEGLRAAADEAEKKQHDEGDESERG